MTRSKLLLVASAFALSLSACQQSGTGTEQAAETPGTELGIVPASMDRSVKPGDDFFKDHAQVRRDSRASRRNASAPER